MLDRAERKDYMSNARFGTCVSVTSLAHLDTAQQMVLLKASLDRVMRIPKPQTWCYGVFLCGLQFDSEAQRSAVVRSKHGPHVITWRPRHQHHFIPTHDNLPTQTESQRTDYVCVDA